MAKVFSFVLVLIVIVFAFIPHPKLETRVSKVQVYEVQQYSSMPDSISKGTRWERAHKFQKFLTPIIRAENSKIIYDHAYVLDLMDKAKLTSLNNQELKWLNEKIKFYKMKEFSISDSKSIQELLIRSDIIPEQIVLAQAAIESNWGTSGFAKRGNNLFGMRTTSRKSGLVPKKRAKGATFRVAVYESINSSVRYYMRNLNTHKAYSEMRNLRLEMRESEENLDPYILANGLTPYSTLGHGYVKIIHNTMNTYKTIFEEQEVSN